MKQLSAERAQTLAETDQYGGSTVGGAKREHARHFAKNKKFHRILLYDVEIKKCECYVQSTRLDETNMISIITKSEKSKSQLSQT